MATEENSGNNAVKLARCSVVWKVESSKSAWLDDSLVGNDEKTSLASVWCASDIVTTVADMSWTNVPMTMFMLEMLSGNIMNMRIINIHVARRSVNGNNMIGQR